MSAFQRKVCFNSAHLFVSTKVARVHPGLIRIPLDGGGRSRRLTNAYAEAWVIVLSRRPAGSKLGETVTKRNQSPPSALSGTSCVVKVHLQAIFQVMVHC